MKRFLGHDSGPAFEGLKRIIEDERSEPNEALIELALKAGWITDAPTRTWPGDYELSRDTRRKKKLSEAQMAQRLRINRQIIRAAHPNSPKRNGQ